MKKSEIIQNKFSNFEPHVDEFTIDKSWKKIKYFVPQKEKKRRFFMLLPVFCMTFTALLFFVIGISSLYKVQEIKKHEGDAQIKQRVTHKDLFKKNHATKRKSITTKKQQQTQPDLFTEKMNGHSTSYIAPRKNTNNPSIPSALNPIFHEKEAPPFEEVSTESQVFVLDTAVKAVDNINPVYEHLQPILLTGPDSNYLNKTIVQKDTIREFRHKRTNRLSFDIVGGSQYAFTQIKHKSENISHRNSGLNYLLGAGVNYLIKNKIYFTSQFVVTKNNLLFEERFTGNRVVKKYQYSPTQVYSDTTYYVKATTYHSLKSNYGFNLGLGIESVLFQKNKITINGILLLNALIANYNYSILRFSETDTLIYIGTNSNTIFPNNNSMNFKEGHSSVSEKSADLGIKPGFVIGYKLNSKATLIFRSSFFLNLSPLKKEDPGSEFTVKQNNLFFQLGIRFSP